MTVFEAYSKMWEFFRENDTFIMEENFHDIILVSDSPSRDKACIQSALDDWVKSEMLSIQKEFGWKKDSPKKDIYILRKSLDSNEQSVSIHPNLAGFITTEINGFCELIEDKTDWCDPTNLGSKDVMNLLHILHFYKGKYKDAIGATENDDEKKI